MRKFWLGMLGLVAALSVTLAGCGSGGSGSDAADDTKSITIAMAAEEIPYINPLNDNGSPGIQVAQALYAPLVRTNPQTGKVENVIAESITPNEDSTVWTIKIKKGLTFDNGQPLTAEDYVESWNMTAQAYRAWANNGFFSKIKGWAEMNPSLEEGEKLPKDLPKKLSGLKVVDDHTFTVELAAPFSPFGLTLQYLGAAPIPEEVRKDPDAYLHKPIGMGAYKVKDGEWKTGTDLVLVKSKTYKGPFAPEADQITFRFIPNAETAYNDFLAGNVDYTTVPATKMGSYKSDAPDQWMESKVAGNIYYLAPSIWQDGLDDPKIRKALSMAINRADYAKLVGLATPASTYIAAGIDGARADSCGEACTFDPAGAKKLLAEAGGFDRPLNIYYSTTSASGQVYAEAIGNMWRQNLGLEIKYIGKTSAEITELSDSRKMDGVRTAGWGHDYPSIEDYLTPVLACSGDANFTQYCNKKMDAVLAKGNAEPDPVKAISYYQQAEDIALADLPLIPLYSVGGASLYSAKIKPQNSPYTGISALYSTFTN